MKTKYLMIPVLTTLVLTGCGKRNQPEPEPQAVVINTNTEEGRAKVNSSLEKSIDLYSNPTNFKALHVSEQVKDVNFDLAASITETTQYGLNELSLSFKNIGFEGEEFVRVGEDRKVEGMVNINNLKGNHAASIAALQPVTGQKEGQEPEGVFAEGQFEIAPSNIKAYFKDGKGYFDLSDEGIRTTLTNANALANEGYRAYQEINAKIKEMEEAAKQQQQQQQPEPQPLRATDPAPQGLDLNAMLDEYTDPTRKFQTVLEAEGFVIDEEDYQPASAEEVAESKAEVKDFIDRLLPGLAEAQILVPYELPNGGLQLNVNINKEKVVNALPAIQAYIEAKEQESDVAQLQQSSLLINEEQQQVEPEEPTWADMFDQMVSKFDVVGKVSFDAAGYLRELEVSYDIALGVEAYPWKFFGLGGNATVDLSLGGKVNASIQYNDEVSFALPEEIEQYAVVNFDD